MKKPVQFLFYVVNDFLVFGFFFCLLLIGYLFSPDIVTADEVYYIHSDHLGSTTTVTDQQGETVSYKNYYPYGDNRASFDSSALTTKPTESSYTGQISDLDQTGLYYYNARYYNPTLAKFTQADSQNDTFNKYAYAANNPTNYTDPTGNYYIEGPGNVNLEGTGVTPVWNFETEYNNWLSNNNMPETWWDFLENYDFWLAVRVEAFAWFETSEGNVDPEMFFLHLLQAISNCTKGKGNCEDDPYSISVRETTLIDVAGYPGVDNEGQGGWFGRWDEIDPEGKLYELTMLAMFAWDSRKDSGLGWIASGKEDVYFHHPDYGSDRYSVFQRLYLISESLKIAEREQLRSGNTSYDTGVGSGPLKTAVSPIFCNSQVGRCDIIAVFGNSSTISGGAYNQTVAQLRAIDPTFDINQIGPDNYYSNLSYSSVLLWQNIFGWEFHFKPFKPGR